MPDPFGAWEGGWPSPGIGVQEKMPSPRRWTPAMVVAQQALLWRIHHQHDPHAAQQLVGQCEGLITSVVRPYVGPLTSLAELQQAGRIGVFKAARAFDAAKGATFATYATHCIKSEVWHLVARAYRLHVHAQDRTVVVSALNGDHPCAEDPDMARVEWHATLRQAMSGLSELQRQVLVRHGVYAMPKQSIARQLGLSTQRVARLWRQASAHIGTQLVDGEA